ncbi:MAG TPA: MFS transporter [Bryobacteraceae bacterium]
MSGVSHAWRALRHRNFRLFFFGQSISLIGSWMTRLATTWLVYRLTHSAMWLGVVGFAGQIVTFLIAPFAGVLIERVDRRRLLVWTQVAAAIQSLALAVLTLARVITLPEILGLAALQGLINAFDMPGRQSFLIQMVEDKQDLGNAIAINSSMANGGRLIGPAIAGVVIAIVGEGMCFLIDGLSYIPVVASLLAMRITTEKTTRPTAGLWEGLSEGWNYVSTFRPVRSVLLLFALMAFVGFPYTVLLPLIAAQVLHGGAATLGWLTAASGIGALASGLSLTLRKTVVGLTRMLQIAATLLGVGLVLLGFSHTLWISLAVLLVVGFGMMQGPSISNTIIQTLTTEDKRVRVMSYYTAAFFGMTPFGSLLAGTLADRFGPLHTLMMAGACCLAGALWFTLELPKMRAVMRPIYQEMGLLPVREPATDPQ